MDMELSSEVYNLLERFKTLPKQNGECGDKVERMPRMGDDEIIHLEEIEFCNDETWLYGTEGPETSTNDLHTWLHSDTNNFTAENFTSQSMKLLSQLNKTSPSKFIDSRTFTRPKKRYSRPSLEKYNEEPLFIDANSSSSENNPSLLAAKLQEMELENDDGATFQADRPFNFDLSQPTNSSIFEKILAEAPGIDSFQNMSPPSLVNSMCSSTFTTLMDSSFIRNDPVLREIRDTDYSETVLLQDSDPPMFQSITDSFCSERGETFVKRPAAEGVLFGGGGGGGGEGRGRVDLDVSDVRRQLEALDIQGGDLSGSVEENVSEKSEKYSSCEMINEDLCVDSAPSVQDIAQLKNIDMNSTVILSTTTTTAPPCLNGTYKRSPKHTNITRNLMAVSTDSLDDAYQHKDEILQNTTFCKNTQNKTLNETFCVEQHVSVVEQMNTERLNETYDYVVKRNSAGYSGGSADSLDRMSSLSNNSSRGSSRMLNMAEVDAIVERQEQSLQVMSTPKPTSSGRKLLDSFYFSPIMNTLERSDSDISSNDEYATGRTSFSKASPANSDSGAINYTGYPEGSLKTVKSANAILQPAQKKPPVRSFNTITKNFTRPMQPASSYTTLVHKMDSNLQKSGGNFKGSQTNLKTVNSQLRGSYTSLKPVNKNLPEVTASLDATQVLSSQGVGNRTVKLTRTETFKVPLPVGDAQSLPVVKPLGRTSNLPRPTNTGIPRPVSRIPAPRTVKSVSSQPSVKQIRQLKDESYF